MNFFRTRRTINSFCLPSNHHQLAMEKEAQRCCDNATAYSVTDILLSVRRQTYVISVKSIN